MRQLADLARHLDPGRTGTDDNESQPLLLREVVRQLSKLKDPKIRPRSSNASSMLFIPGAHSEN